MNIHEAHVLRDALIAATQDPDRSGDLLAECNITVDAPIRATAFAGNFVRVSHRIATDTVLWAEWHSDGSWAVLDDDGNFLHQGPMLLPMRISSILENTLAERLNA